MVKKKYNWLTRNYLNRLLVLGIMLTGFGIYQFPKILTFKSNLTQIKGTLSDADIYITNVSEGEKHDSRKSDLIFYINGRQQKFYLTENIGKGWRNEKFEKILHGLKRTDTITVWVRKGEVEEYEPEIFQINNERTTLLDFETVRTAEGPVTAFMFLTGICSLIVFFRFRFPDKFNEIFGSNK